ncbi:fimbria/pilus outer membrane usher protein [Enterobacter hormaechei]|uniref:fimbria/pilus outer membrane usher protein n=1 Tax=Enterobacter hormaechei TaxID=158836 RepID=UPI00188CA5B8|nr:fimbria/pilus outer membrane usher protein [Enterobacter hormaechei]MBF4154933.1 fimbria/pilus outer membrane usher protein [Enterobacter hormaechei]
MHILNYLSFLMIASYLTVSLPFARAELYFPPSLVGDESNVADLSHFEKMGAQMPGIYPVNIWLNGKPVFSQSLRFVMADNNFRDRKNKTTNSGHTPDNTGLMACLTKNELMLLRVNMNLFLSSSVPNDEACLSIESFIPGAWTYFDFQKMRLDISIPQIALQTKVRGFIPSELWDEGINAALLSYSFTGNEKQADSGISRYQYLNLTSGLNIGPWRLRDRSNWTNQSSRHNTYQRWQHGITTLSRAIIPWRSELTLGDATTGADVFDSFGFRGARLSTDDSMLPDSLRGYAPVIRGSAGSNASVSISQNGYEIYQTTVAPGEFAISDIYPMYASGDLVVKVIEANGHVNTFTVPYSSVPVLIREGMTKYDVAIGTYRSTEGNYDKPTLLQGILVHGLPYGITTYGGGQYTTNYQSAALGAGINVGTLGAISADITHADSTLSDGSRHKGQSVRFLYASTLNSLGTTFQLAGYRYSTRGFHTLGETAQKRMSGWQYEQDESSENGRKSTDYYNLYDNKRQRLQVNISQRLGDFGSLYLSGSRQSFWNRKDISESLQAGFSSSLGPVSYNVSFNHTRTAGYAYHDQSVYLSLSMPLGKWLPDSFATFNSSRDNRGNTSFQSSLSGSLLKEHNLNWNIAQGSGNRSDLRLDHRGSYANTNIGFSRSDNYRQFNYGISGGMIIHRDGLTLGQPLGDTNILVAAPGASGVALENGTGIHTDWRGYTIRPSASGYKENRVALDSSTLDDQTEIDSAVANVVPTRGAIARASFNTRSGIRALVTLSHKGKPLPFGAMVSNADNNSIVGDEGQVYLTGLTPEGILEAQWGKGDDQKCIAKYMIPPAEQKTSIAQIDAICQ